MNREERTHSAMVRLSSSSSNLVVKTRDPRVLIHKTTILISTKPSKIAKTLRQFNEIGIRVISETPF